MESIKINLKNHKGKVLDNSYTLRYNGEDLYDNTLIRFFGYVRVSTEKQRETGSSVECQISYIKEECRNKNYSLIAIYVDDGISGCYLKDRYAYDCMLKNIQNNLHRIKPSTLGVMVTSLSRMTRNMVDNENFLKFITDNELLLNMLDNPNADPTDPNTKLFIGMKALVNRMDADTIRYNTTTAMRNKVERGELKGRSPYGLDSGGNPIQIEQDALEHIYRLHDEGKDNHEILGMMNNGFNYNNIPIKISYNNFKGRREPRDKNESKMGVWTRSSIKTIIERYIYSKRDINSGISIRDKDKTIRNVARKMREEDPNITYAELTRRINEMSIFKCILKADYVHKLIQSNSENQSKQEHIFKAYQKILEIKRGGIETTSKIASKLNKLNIPPPGRGMQWYNTTVESFIKRCEEDPPIDVTLKEGFAEDDESPEGNVTKNSNDPKIRSELEGTLRIELEDKIRIELEYKIRKEMEEKIRKEYEEKSRKSRFV